MSHSRTITDPLKHHPGSATEFHGKQEQRKGINLLEYEARKYRDLEFPNGITIEDYEKMRKPVVSVKPIKRIQKVDKQDSKVTSRGPREMFDPLSDANLNPHWTIDEVYPEKTIHYGDNPSFGSSKPHQNPTKLKLKQSLPGLGKSLSSRRKSLSEQEKSLSEGRVLTRKRKSSEGGTRHRKNKTTSRRRRRTRTRSRR